MKSIRYSAWCLALVLAIGSTALGQSQQVVVPAYFGIPPSCTTPGSGCSIPALGNDWSRIQNAGTGVKMVVADGSFKTLSGSSLTAAISQFDANRSSPNYQLVFGYVDTGTGTRTIECSGAPPCGSIMDDVRTWYANYSGHIDGVFFDDGPYLTASGQDATYQTFYTSLYTNVTAPGHSYSSAKILLNGSQFPCEWVMSVAHYVVTWEKTLNGTGGAPDYASHYSASNPAYCATSSNSHNPPDWWSSSTYSGRLIHVVYGAAASDLDAILSDSQSRGSPSLYAHSVSGANYSAIPSFFEEEVAIFTKTGLTFRIGTGSPNPPNPDDFGTAGADVTHSFTVKNTRTSSTSPLTASITGANASLWSIVSDGCTGNSLAAGATCTVAARFLSGSSSAGTYNAVIQVAATTGGVAKNALTGVATGTHLLAVNPAGLGSGTVVSTPSGINCGSSCSSTFTHGSTVVLTATAYAGSTFVGFSGGGCSTSPCTIAFNAATSVTATFNPGSYTLTVTTSGDGSGTVSSSPAGISGCSGSCSASFSAGSSISLTATTSSGVFTGFDACTPQSGPPNPCSITMSGDKTVNASFSCCTACNPESPGCSNGLICVC